MAWSKLDTSATGWQPKTKWRSGLSDSEIQTVEAETGFRFPKEYQFFLSRLHTTSKPYLSYLVDADVGKDQLDPGFYDWINGRAAIERQSANFFELMFADVEGDGEEAWHDGWGGKL